MTISTQSIEMLSAMSYLIAGVCFILALKGLASPATARKGNVYGIFGMIIAIVTTFLTHNIEHPYKILLCIAGGGLIGTVIALRIKMTAMPQLVAAFHSLVGLAAVCVAGAALHAPDAFHISGKDGIHTASSIEMGLGTIVGAITFAGSIIAFLKLQGTISGKPVRFHGQHLLNLIITIITLYILTSFVQTPTPQLFWTMSVLAFVLGLLLIIPVGGADMPVIVSMLNSYSGWAAAGIGFTLNNSLLIITGALVGASGAILSYIMCKAMNRSLINVIFGGLHASTGTTNQTTIEHDTQVNQGNSEDAAFMLKQSQSIIIVPGYGMAVAQAQHSLKEMTDLLQAQNISVKYAIHPVAGRMPGHMNVLLAEANVPYDQVFELEDINQDFSKTDIAFVIGANDITNPIARTDKNSPIYGMPVLDVEKAGHVLFVKRGLSSGYAGVDNPLFYNNNTIMLFGDAKQVCEQIVKAMK